MKKLKVTRKLLSIFMVMLMVISAITNVSAEDEGVKVLTLKLLADTTDMGVGDTIQLEAELNQKLEENTFLTYEFTNGVDGFGGNFEYNEESKKYTCTHYIDETIAPGNYTLRSLSVQGEMTNQLLEIKNLNVSFNIENKQYEESRPKVTGISGVEKEYKTNEVIKLRLDVESIYELDENAVVIFKSGNKTIEMKLNLDGTSYTGEVTIPKGISGEWKLSDILLSSSHEYMYYSVSDSYKEIAKDIIFTVEEISVEEDSKPNEDTSKEEQTNKTISQEAIQEAISNISQQSQVVVNMEDATVVPKDILEAAKGKNVDITFKMDGYSWIINGTNITNAQDINLEVKFGLDNIPSELKKEKALDNPYQEISLTHNGEFGFKANLQMLVDEKYAGMSANLYYYTENGLEYMSNNIIDKDGFVSLDFSHASDYLLIIKEKENTSIDTSDDTHQDKQETQHPVDTSDTSQALFWGIILGVSGLSLLSTLKRILVNSGLATLLKTKLLKKEN